MKRILFALLAIFFTGLLFSCKTTDVADAAQADEVLQAPVPNEDAPEKSEEISESDVALKEEADENASEALDEKSADSETEIAKATEPEQPEQPEQMEQKEKGPEKIPEEEVSEWGLLLDEEEKKPEAQSTRVSVQGSRQGQKAANTTPTPDSAPDATTKRITSEGSTVQGGPKIGPSVPEPRADGRDLSVSERYNFDGTGKKEGGAQDQNDIAGQEGLLDGEDLAGDEGPEEEEEEPEPEPIVPSRHMDLKNNQTVDIAYPGTGWIYLGEVEREGHFIFQGRRLGKDGTTFTLRSKKGGKATLHFYKNDALTGKYIDDYIEINVSNEGARDPSSVEAPRYADAVPPKYERKPPQQKETPQTEEPKKLAQTETAQKAPPKAGGSPVATAEKSPRPPGEEGHQGADGVLQEKVQTVIQTDSAKSGREDESKRTSVSAAPRQASDEKSDAPGGQNGAETNGARSPGGQSLLEQAQKAYDEKRYADALHLVQQFFDQATEGFDAALYLEGLILEAKSEVRNIKSAIDAYDTLIKNWPESNFWRRATERSIYLKRFYIDIR